VSKGGAFGPPFYDIKWDVFIPLYITVYITRRRPSGSRAFFSKRPYHKIFRAAHTTNLTAVVKVSVYIRYNGST